MADCRLRCADGFFELLIDDTAIGERRALDAQAGNALQSFAERYRLLLGQSHNPGALLKLGSELFDWLDGDRRDFSALINRASAPLIFEIEVPNGLSKAEWALVNAPFELLADDEGFLAEDARLQFCPLRRIGKPSAPTPLDDRRLGLAFMASAPRGQRELDYEAEESAILQAVGDRAIDLLVEESGDPNVLGPRLRDAEDLQALHLSCHGLNNWRDPNQPDAKPQPVLAMEDEVGNTRMTTSADLHGRISNAGLRLVFLSACLSAASADAEVPSRGDGREGVSTGRGRGRARGDQIAHSFATSLVSSGMPAVLGWDGSVADVAATAFATTLYERLNARDDLAVAVGQARRALLRRDHQSPEHQDWHMARLWLGRSGGGRLVNGSVARSTLAASFGHDDFLDDDQQQVKVAPPSMFVGRRRQIQDALKAVRSESKRGVLLHGMGRLGKSSLAARLANRLREDMALAVVFKSYDALSVVEALERALITNEKACDLLEARKDEVRKDAGRLKRLLVALLKGPCKQKSGAAKPILLVVDDLERILDDAPSTPDGRRRFSQNAEVIAALIDAFDPNITDSRLVFTSRFPFTLDGREHKLDAIQLPPFSERAQAKLEQRQREAATSGDLPLAAHERDARLKHHPRVKQLARGNPGLQALIGEKLILNPAVRLDRAETALDDMQTWLDGGDLPAETEIRAFLEGLDVDTLIELAGADGKALLRAMTLFTMPIPEPVAKLVEHKVGGALTRLRALGLLDGFEDVVEHKTTALAVNDLAAGRLKALSAQEQATIAALAAQPLFGAWGGAEGRLQRPGRAAVQLCALAFLADNAEIIEACAGDALNALEGEHAEARAAFGKKCIALLDKAGQPVPWLVLAMTGRAIATAGDGNTADALLARGVEALSRARADSEQVDPFDAAYLLIEHADGLVRRGQLDEAQPLFEEAAELAEQADRPEDVAVVRGRVADILEARGELDAAWRIYTHELLPVFERLGKVRSKAITMGRIADILEARGALDAALRIRTDELLPAFERLGDVRSKAATMGKIADIHVARGALDEALRIQQDEVLPAVKRLGDVGAKAVTMGKIANIHVARGALDEAWRIYTDEELPVYKRLGDVRAKAVTMGKIANIHVARGELDKARALQEQRLAITEQLGDADGIANSAWDLAQLDMVQEDVASAAPRLTRAFELAAQMGRAEGIAVVGAYHGQSLVAAGKRNDGLAVLHMSADAFKKLGRDAEAAEVEQIIQQIENQGPTT